MYNLICFKGLSFYPTLRHLNNNQTLDDLECFFWCLHLKELFVDEEHQESNDAGDLCLNVRTDVTKQLNLHAHKSKDNLMSEEWSALHGLRQKDDIIIEPADKGSAVVVQSTQDYIKEADCQLNNTT